MQKMEHNGSFVLAVGDCSYYIVTSCWLLFPLYWIRLSVTFPIILGQTVGYCSNNFESICWLRYPLFWIRLFVTFVIILNQVVGYGSHYFGSGCWWLFPLFWIMLLVTVPIPKVKAVGYCSHYIGSCCWLLFPLQGIRLFITVLFQGIRLLVTVNHYFESGCWLPFPLFWIRLLVTVTIILDQVVYLQLFVGGFMPYLYYLCLFVYSSLQHTLCILLSLSCVFCTWCWHFLWIVHSWLPLWGFFCLVSCVPGVATFSRLSIHGCPFHFL